MKGNCIKLRLVTLIVTLTLIFYSSLFKDYNVPFVKIQVSNQGVIGKNYQLLYRRGRGFFFAAPIECPVYLWCALCMLGPTVVVGSSSLHPLSLRAIYSVRYACWTLNELAGTGDPSS